MMNSMHRLRILPAMCALLWAVSLVFSGCAGSPAPAPATGTPAVSQTASAIPSPQASAGAPEASPAVPTASPTPAPTPASTPTPSPAPSPTPSPEPTATEAPAPAFGAAGGNLANGGSWCFTDGVLYGMQVKSGKYGIYAQSQNSSKKLADGIGSQLNVSGGFLYYLSYPQGLLCKVPLDGSSKPKKLGGKAMLFVLVAGDQIYYTLKSSAALYRMGTDGSGSKLICSGKCYDLGGSGSTVYYTDTKKGAFCMLDTLTGKTASFPMKSRGFAQLMDGKVYFQNEADGKKLYVCNADGSEKRVLFGKAITGINVTEQAVYFSNKADRGKAYRVNLDGSSPKKAADVKAEFITVAGPALYIVSDSKKGLIYRVDETGKCVKLG